MRTGHNSTGRPARSQRTADCRAAPRPAPPPSPLSRRARRARRAGSVGGPGASRRRARCRARDTRSRLQPAPHFDAAFIRPGGGDPARGRRDARERRGTRDPLAQASRFDAARELGPRQANPRQLLGRRSFEQHAHVVRRPGEERAQKSVELALAELAAEGFDHRKRQRVRRARSQPLARLLQRVSMRASIGVARFAKRSQSSSRAAASSRLD